MKIHINLLKLYIVNRRLFFRTWCIYVYTDTTMQNILIQQMDQMQLEIICRKDSVCLPYKYFNNI